MQTNLMYWTAALVNLAAVLVFVVVGVRCIRLGDVARHRIAMQNATALVVCFVACYALKLVLVGREDRSTWSSTDLAVLYAHETFIALMLLGGIWAGAIAWRSFRAGAVATPDVTALDPAARKRHGRLGWIAVGGAVLGLATAAFVLLGMSARAA